MTGMDIHFSRAVRLVCMLALVMVGFAHKPVMAEAPFAVQFAAYVLPDGTLPTLCITDDGRQKSKPGDVVMDRGCDACRLSATVLLPTPPQVGAATLIYSYEAPLFERQVYLVQRLYPPSSGPRAPPYTVMMS